MHEKKKKYTYNMKRLKIVKRTNEVNKKMRTPKTPKKTTTESGKRKFTGLRRKISEQKTEKKSKQRKIQNNKRGYDIDQIERICD